MNPFRDPQHGPLPAALLALTFVTGLVDAVSYLGLGHVFVANMTGNVVFIGFALAGTSDVSLGATGAALLAFAFGAVVGGRLGVRLGKHRGRLLAIATAGKVCLIIVATVVALRFAPLHDPARYLMIVVLACAMGIQNAVARRIAVAELTTTVLTMTITGLAADSRWAGGSNVNFMRRASSVVAMLVGALVGGLLVLHVHAAVALGLAAATLAATGLTMWRISRAPSTWSAAR